MGNLLLAFAVLAVAIFFSLQKRRGAVRALQKRCATELSQLQRNLASRHLIVSHLVDSLPQSFDGEFDRTGITAAREQAQRSVQAMDPDCPRAIDLHSISNHEQELLEQTVNLTRRIEASPRLLASQSVSGCLHGLAGANRTIIDSSSTYNASVITYQTFLESRISRFLVRALKLQAGFRVIDIGQYSSDSSTSHHALV